MTDKLIPQIPAVGIMQTGNFGPSKSYKIACECTEADCEHMLYIDVDDFAIEVNIYTKVHTKWWSTNRWKQIWEILTKGYAEYQSTIVLNEQSALNYAATLEKAIEDLNDFKDAKYGKKND